jgi:hypothetical protein
MDTSAWSSWDPQLSALGGLQRCPGCDPPEYGRSPCLPSALPELGSTGGPIDVVGLYDVSGSRFPTSTCSASSNW